MKVSIESIKQLREKTNASVGDCRKALVQSKGNIDNAMKHLREMGIKAASKKAARSTSAGRIESYVHLGNRIGVLVEINCETDFVARNEQFIRFSKDIAMQIAAVNPKYISRDQVSEEEANREREVLTQQALQEGKPENIVAKMVEGRLNKFFEEICLLDQAFVKNPDEKVKQVVGAKNATVQTYVRYEVGEGIEKRQDNFAEEVMSQVKK